MRTALSTLCGLCASLCAALCASDVLMTHRVIPGRVHDLHQHLARLDTEALARRVRQMVQAGIGEQTIAALTGLSISYVREILAVHVERGE